jgi:hypothetical protein
MVLYDDDVCVYVCAQTGTPASLGMAAVRKTASFLSFPYVFPEPVLAKCSILYINGSKKDAVFRTT